MQRYRSRDATFILNELPLRSTSAHGILISGYAHASHGKTRQLKVQILLENPCINAFVITYYQRSRFFFFLFFFYEKKKKKGNNFAGQFLDSQNAVNIKRFH